MRQNGSLLTSACAILMLGTLGGGVVGFARNFEDALEDLRGVSAAKSAQVAAEGMDLDRGMEVPGKASLMCVAHHAAPCAEVREQGLRTAGRGMRGMEEAERGRGRSL